MKRIALSCLLVVACAAPTGEDQNDSGAPAPDAAPAKDAAAKKDAQSNADAKAPLGDAATPDAQSFDASDASAPQAIVYGHTPDTLYSFDPTTNTVTLVGAFTNCTQGTTAQVIDLAIDSQMNAYVTTFDGFYSVDLQTAACTLIKAGAYPNSLSFVPAGTLDPNLEALVGYFGNAYVRVNVGTGNTSSVGTLTGGYASSGDIVSVEGGGSFLTVTGNGCGDCLLQVDPKTGDVIQNYGQLPHGAVYGLGYWAGTLFGFDANGDVFSIGGGGDAGLVTSDITVGDGGVTWWGAGSTTIAPATSLDGGAISTQ
jgi:hypothetical protein